ncbi:hypothetical protein M427DRAFT_32628 [Gonapodya prolifera JEL478]|uniref:Uncharacterized protein n=1 Tax=Gonapodya prolifera (strain JEL478) TaxID=1344416 RepID=A0A139AEJ3_GONPJ|nr:hypothetical protein M427DRAFT_32628 [Gonapodya prolifera JEL478]|eukprot:KXS15178.1 hypothetical protein M427DRAFT_32628 [Gonapodya prolifera JEL478]
MSRLFHGGWQRGRDDDAGPDAGGAAKRGWSRRGRDGGGEKRGRSMEHTRATYPPPLPEFPDTSTRQVRSASTFAAPGAPVGSDRRWAQSKTVEPERGSWGSTGSGSGLGERREWSLPPGVNAVPATTSGGFLAPPGHSATALPLSQHPPAPTTTTASTPFFLSPDPASLLVQATHHEHMGDYCRASILLRTALRLGLDADATRKARLRIARDAVRSDPPRVDEAMHEVGWVQARWGDDDDGEFKATVEEVWKVSERVKADVQRRESRSRRKAQADLQRSESWRRREVKADVENDEEVKEVGSGEVEPNATTRRASSASLVSIASTDPGSPIVMPPSPDPEAYPGWTRRAESGVVACG